MSPDADSTRRGVLLSEEGARSLLRPFEDAFVRAHLHAWEQWMELDKLCQTHAPALLIPVTDTTRANFVNNHAAMRIDVELSDVVTESMLKVSEALGFTTVLVMAGQQAALLRLKLLDGDLRWSNVSTERQKMLARQEMYEDLLTELGCEGTVSPTIVTCGYEINDENTAIKSISMVCRHHGHLEWHYEIFGEASGLVADIPLPNMPRPSSRVISKRAERRPTRDNEQRGSES